MNLDIFHYFYNRLTHLDTNLESENERSFLHCEGVFAVEVAETGEMLFGEMG